jgi:multiple sugar transport system substrate-binding protein
MPAGPYGRLGLGQSTGVYSIWKFARNQDAAQQFLVDQCKSYEEATLASKLFNFPSFPGAFPLSRIRTAAAADGAAPRGKYSILATVATRYTRNVGYPGYANAAVAETLDSYLIPHMFGSVSQGKMTAAQSVRATAKRMSRIWAKWREAGKI